MSPTFVAEVPGVYVAQLIVNDGAVDSAPDTVKVVTDSVATAVLGILDASAHPSPETVCLSARPSSSTGHSPAILAEARSSATRGRRSRVDLVASSSPALATTVPLDDLLAGPIQTSDPQLVVEPIKTMLAVGKHELALQVVDDSGNASEARLVVTVQPVRGALP